MHSAGSQTVQSIVDIISRRSSSTVARSYQDSEKYNTKEFRVLVKWEGWASDHNTWEPLKAVDGRGVGHKEAVQAYLVDAEIHLEDNGLAAADGSQPEAPAAAPAAPVPVPVATVVAKGALAAAGARPRGPRVGFLVTPPVQTEKTSYNKAPSGERMSSRLAAGRAAPASK